MKNAINEFDKNYISPSLEILALTVDVITASGGSDEDEGKWDPRKKARIW